MGHTGRWLQNGYVLISCKLFLEQKNQTKKQLLKPTLGKHIMSQLLIYIPPLQFRNEITILTCSGTVPLLLQASGEVIGGKDTWSFRSLTFIKSLRVFFSSPLLHSPTSPGWLGRCHCSKLVIGCHTTTTHNQRDPGSLLLFLPFLLPCLYKPICDAVKLRHYFK